MAITDKQKREYMRRILMSRLRILTEHGFYGLLLMHMEFALDEECGTAYTDGRAICFSPAFLDEISDSELDFIMMHEILHVVLQHCFRQKDRDSDIFNIACDIVVNSTILKSNNMDISSITLRKYGESMHRTPSGDEGYDYTAEQVYEEFNGSCGKRARGNSAGSGSGGRAGSGSGEGSGSGSGDGPGNTWDDHSKWQDGSDSDDDLEKVWNRRLAEACGAMKVRDPSNTRGTIPLCAERVFKELTRPQTDWRTVLQDFVQEEVTDYSFDPPDRRFGDSPFFLPDFNDTEESVKNILFMIDTSGSISDDMMTAAYSEVKGAIDQFGGKLCGWLGFFDAAVTEPVPFADEEEFEAIRPRGGGGTSFNVIFKYVQNEMSDNLPVSIIILTDGYAPFPKETATCGIPVLWVINNDEVSPPWGKIARIKVE